MRPLPALLLAVLLIGPVVPLLAQGPSLPAPPRPRDLVVNEIHYAPSPAELEFIELLNRTDRSLDLSRLGFSDDRGVPHAVGAATLPLPPGGYVVLARSGSAFAAAYPGVPYVQPPVWPALNNGGDAVVLRYGALVLDSLTYTPAWGGRDASLERRDPGGPSTAPSNWGSSVDPQRATPGRPNSLFAPDLAPPVPRLALQAAGAVLDVYFDGPLDPATLLPAAFRVEERAAATVRALSDTIVQARFDRDLTGTTLRIGGIADLAGNRLETAALPIARLPEPGRLLVNEILYAPRADPFDGRPDQPEYVELYSLHPHPVSLHGLYWSTRANEAGRGDTLRLSPAPAVLAPGGFAVVHAARPAGSAGAGSLLEAAFPDLDASAPGVTLLPLPRSTLGLRNGGDLLRLSRRDGTILDEVPYTPAWHHPGLVEATGVSLERLLPQGPSDSAANWGSSTAPAGGTPGAPNHLSVALQAPPARAGLLIAPSPFSPDADGHDDVTAIQYRLVREAALVRVRIYDGHGRLVRRLEEAALVPQRGHLLWDGFDDAGRPLRIGPYVVHFEAVPAGGGAAETYRQSVILARPLTGD